MSPRPRRTSGAVTEIVEIACRHCGTLRTWQRAEAGALVLVRDVFGAVMSTCPKAGTCEPRELASPMSVAFARHLRDTRGRRMKRR